MPLLPGPERLLQRGLAGRLAPAAAGHSTLLSSDSLLKGAVPAGLRD